MKLHYVWNANEHSSGTGEMHSNLPSMSPWYQIPNGQCHTSNHLIISSPANSTISQLRRSPRHPQNFKNLPLALTSDTKPPSQLNPPAPPQRILKQTPLIQPHPLLTSKQSQRPIKNIIPREINQCRATFFPRHTQQIQAPV